MDQTLPNQVSSVGSVLPDDTQAPSQQPAPQPASAPVLPRRSAGIGGMPFYEPLEPATAPTQEAVNSIVRPETVAPEKTAEQQKTPETAPAETPSTTEDPQKAPTAEPATTASQPPKTQVVDKTKEKQKLKTLNTQDTLTTLADKEEEEFIQKVEAAHEP